MMYVPTIWNPNVTDAAGIARTGLGVGLVAQMKIIIVDYGNTQT
jgi:hypothetical protein